MTTKGTYNLSHYGLAFGQLPERYLEAEGNCDALEQFWAVLWKPKSPVAESPWEWGTKRWAGGRVGW